MSSYVPDPNDATQPTDAVSAETAAPEFRALKAKVNTMALASGNKNPVRQCVLDGIKDVNGNAAFLIGGSGGLTAKLLATAGALYVSFANGFSNTGAVDYVGVISNDTDNYWAGLPANAMQFLSIDYNLGTGALTPTQTPQPPQYGPVYDNTANAMLHFEGAVGTATFTDDYGNTWTQGGAAKLETNSVKIGVSALGGQGTANNLDGAHDYISCANIFHPGEDGWTLETWVNASALPAASVFAAIAAIETAAGYGVRLSIYNNAGTIKFAYNLSNNGTSYNITSTVQGVTTPVVGTWYHVALVYDPVAQTYYLYVNGTKENSTASALLVSGGNALVIGAAQNGAACFFNGYIDEFIYSHYCKYPNGTAFVPATVAGTPVGDWYDIDNCIMQSITGAGPVFTTIARTYVGEVLTSGAAPTILNSYAFKGRCELPWTKGIPATTTAIAGNHNLGTKRVLVESLLENIIGDYGFTPGQQTTWLTESENTGYYSVPVANAVAINRCKFNFAVGSAYAALILDPITGLDYAATLANWKYKLRFRRSF